MGVPELNRSQGFSFTKQMPYPLTRQISLNLRPIAFGAQHSCQMPLYHPRLIPTAQQRKVGSIGDERKACQRGEGGPGLRCQLLGISLKSRKPSVTPCQCDLGING